MFLFKFCPLKKLFKYSFKAEEEGGTLLLKERSQAQYLFKKMKLERQRYVAAAGEKSAT